MWLYYLNAIIFISVFCNKIEIGRAAQISKFTVIDKDTNSLCTDYHIEWDILAPSDIACVMRCSTNSQCLGTVYKADGHFCYGLHSGHEAAPCATKTSGGIVYLKLPEACPSGWESVSKWCYMFTAEEEEWQTASELCKSYSEVSHLAYVNTNEEYAAISSWIQSFWYDEKMWLGGYRIDNTDKWTWANGVEITDDFNWGEQEPDNEYPTDCLLVYSHLVDFGDRGCDHEYSSVCELDIYD